MKYTATKFAAELKKKSDQSKGQLTKKTYRHTAYIVAPFMEDLFAKYLEKLLGKEVDRILIDVSMTIGSKQHKPDIVLIRGNEIIGFFDCKTSVGYHRDEVKEMAEKYAGALQAVRKHESIVKIAGQEYSVSNDAVWDILINDIWGSGSKKTVKEQVDEWNNCKNRQFTRIWWVKNRPVTKGAEVEFNENVFNDILQRLGHEKI